MLHNILVIYYRFIKHNRQGNKNAKGKEKCKIMKVSREEIEKAKRIDLLTYLINHEPQNLKKESSNSYCTVEHNSLKVSNGMWFWFSRGIGGKSALDYLIKVKGYTLPQAVAKINGRMIEKSPVFYYSNEEKILKIPDLSEKTNMVFYYLKSRGIDPKIITYCLNNRLIFETEKYHNVMFVGYDETGDMKYANLRGTHSNFKGEVYGSDKKHAFKICDIVNPTNLHIFEAAIDLLSYITMSMMSGKDWTKEAYLSLGGVAVNGKTLPMQLKHFLDGNKLISTIYLHLDNDDAGKQASETLKKHLESNYQVIVHFPVLGKDVNDDLMILKGLKKNREEKER